MKGRFSAEEFEPPLRWHVYDVKYEDKGSPFLVDLEEKPHGMCGCKEFHFQCFIGKKRTTCVHIDFLIKHLTALKKRPRNLKPFKRA